MTLKLKTPAKPAKAGRTLSWDAAAGILTVKQDGKEYIYLVDHRLACEGHVHAFTLTKLAGSYDAGDPACYEVTVAADTSEAKCGCKGWEFRRACKHSDGLKLLVARGKYNQ